MGVKIHDNHGCDDCTWRPSSVSITPGCREYVVTPVPKNNIECINLIQYSSKKDNK